MRNLNLGLDRIADRLVALGEQALQAPHLAKKALPDLGRELDVVRARAVVVARTAGGRGRLWLDRGRRERLRQRRGRWRRGLGRAAEMRCRVGWGPSRAVLPWRRVEHERSRVRAECGHALCSGGADYVVEAAVAFVPALHVFLERGELLLRLCADLLLLLARVRRVVRRVALGPSRELGR